ncbi:DUF3995 domain-containing protein [Devosia sp.]|uniref:DUF3995 domain-containing protein n=1 Tax=Devosia sp. TaxID=1871048 RepID=UPI0035B3AEAB
MSMGIASLVFVLLLTVALAHFLWALGSPWPIRDPVLLARAVIGRPGVTRVPRLGALLVAILVLAAGIVALSVADHTAGGLGLSLLGGGVGMAFIARGIAGYTAWWRARFPEEPFATLDRRNYSPLCLLVGAGFLVLVAMRFT